MAIGSIYKSRQSVSERTCALSKVQEALVSHIAEDVDFLVASQAPMLLNHARLVVFASRRDCISRGCA